VEHSHEKFYHYQTDLMKVF